MMFSRFLMNTMTMIARTNATVMIVLSIVMPVTFVHSASLDVLLQCMKQLPNGATQITLPPNMNYDQFNDAMRTKLTECSETLPKEMTQIIASYLIGLEKQSNKEMSAALRKAFSHDSAIELSIRVGTTYFLKLPLTRLSKRHGKTWECDLVRYPDVTLDTLKLNVDRLFSTCSLNYADGRYVIDFVTNDKLTTSQRTQLPYYGKNESFQFLRIEEAHVHVSRYRDKDPPEAKGFWQWVRGCLCPEHEKDE